MRKYYFFIVIVSFLTLVNCTNKNSINIKLESHTNGKSPFEIGGSPFRLCGAGLYDLLETDPLYSQIEIPEGYKNIKLTMFHFQ